MHTLTNTGISRAGNGREKPTKKTLNETILQTMDLYDDPKLIAAYVAEHNHVWEEVKEGFHTVGILDMQIYIYGTCLFMIMDTTDEFDFERDYTRLGTLPRQAEWEAHMSKYQKARPEDSPHEKWKLMKRIFKL